MRGWHAGVLGVGLLLVSLAPAACWMSNALAQVPTQTFRQLMREGQRLSSVGNLRGASAKYAAAAKAATNEQELAEALTAHAVAQRNLDRPDQAEEDLRRAIGLPGAGAFRRAAMFQLASLLEEQDRLDEAISLYRNVAARLRDRPAEAAEALLAAARLLVEHGRFREAREVLTKLAIDELPPHLRSEAGALRLEADLGAGDVEAATRAIGAAGVAGTQLSQLYVRLARVLLDQNRPKEALQACQSAIEADPANGAAWRIQYDIALAQGTADALRADVEAKLAADPDNELLVQRLACYGEWDPDPRKGLEILRRLAELRPHDAGLLERAGACANLAGENDIALEFYHAALALQPQDSGLHFRIGEVLAKIGRRTEATEAFRRGSHHVPGDEESTRQLGTILVRAGLHDEAIAEYQALRRLTGNEKTMAYEMAEALAPIRPEEALSEYVRAASVSLEDADVVTPEAIKLARSVALLSRLAELAERVAVQERSPGAIFLFAATLAAQGEGDAGVAKAVDLGLSTDGLLLLGERLEAESDEEAAALAYAAVAEHSGAPNGLRVEMGVRAAEMFIEAGRTGKARGVLQIISSVRSGSQPLLDRAAFLLADLNLAAGHELSAAEETFTRLAEGSPDPDLRRRSKWRLADVLFARGELAQAEERYVELSREAPSLGIALPPPPPESDTLRLRLPFTALVAHDSLLQEDPRTTPAYAAFQVAECAFRRGEFERARARFAQVAEAYPDSLYANDAVERRLFIATHFVQSRPEANAYLETLTQAHADTWEAALQKLRDIAAMGVTEPLADDAAMLCAALLESHGRLDEAAQEYRTLSERFPGSLLCPEALLRAALLARSLGSQVQAREDLTSLLQKYPTAPMAKTAALWLDNLDHGRPWP